jgi:hypothetical protein
VPASLDVWYYNCFFVQLVQQMDAGFPKNDLERRSGQGKGDQAKKMLIEYNAGTAGGKRADRIAKLTGSLARGSGSWRIEERHESPCSSWSIAGAKRIAPPFFGGASKGGACRSCMA